MTAVNLGHVIAKQAVLLLVKKVNIYSAENKINW